MKLHMYACTSFEVHRSLTLLKNYTPIFNRLHKTKKTNWKWLSVAASVVLLVSVYTGYQNNQQQKAEKIYNETRMALGMLSDNLNKGNNAIAQLQYFEDAKSKVFK